MQNATKITAALALSVSLLTAGACTRTEQNIAAGAGLGAAGGAIVGAATGGSALGGAAIGGAAGAGAGYLLSR